MLAKSPLMSHCHHLQHFIRELATLYAPDLSSSKGIKGSLDIQGPRKRSPSNKKRSAAAPLRYSSQHCGQTHWELPAVSYFFKKTNTSDCKMFNYREPNVQEEAGGKELEPCIVRMEPVCEKWGVDKYSIPNSMSPKSFINLFDYLVNTITFLKMCLCHPIFSLFSGKLKYMTF